MAAEFIDDTLDGSGQFPTKIPGYEDAADIQEALRLYHYGADTIPATPTQINPKSIAGYLKQLQTNIDNSVVDQSALAGVGIDWNLVSEQFDIDSTVATKANVASLTSTVTKASNFTLELVDASNTILLNTSSSMTLTIPLNSSVAIPIGYQFHFIEIGSGRTTFSPASGVTVGSKNSQLFLDGTYSKGTLVKIATDAWVLYGDVYEGVASTTAAPTTTTAAPVVTTTTAAPVVTTTTGAPPSFPFFAPATTTTVAPPVSTTTTVAPPVVTTTTVAPPVATTTTVAPSVSFTTLPYETNVTHTSFTINWVAANAGSWRVYDGGTDIVFGEGNGNPTSFSRTGLTPSSQYTQTVRVWTGANFTGTSVSDPITVGTNMDPNQSFWATGCCSTSGTQVTGDSSVNATFAENDMRSRCVGGTVTDVQTGSNSAVPVLTTCGLTVPNVVGSSLSVATSTLSESGFVYAAGTATTVGATSSNNGLVASQNPPAGNIATPGSTVTLSTYNYVAGTTTTVAPGATTTTVAPTTTTAAPTYTRNETRSVSSSQCPSLNGYYAVTYANSNYTGEISATFLNCIEVATTTTSAPTTTTAAPGVFDVALSSKTSTTANVSWSGAPALTVVYEVDINGGSVTNTSSTSRSFSGLTPNTSYTVTVKAKNSSFSTLATDSVTFTTDAVATTTTSAPVTTTTAAPTYSRQETRFAGQCSYGEGIYNVTYANSNYTGEISSVFLNCIEVTTTTTSAPVVTTTTSAPTTTTSAPVVTTTTSAPVVTTTTSAPVVTTTTSAPVVTTTTSAPVVTTTTSAPVVTTTTTTAAPTGFKICTSLDVANSFCYMQGCDNGGCGNGSSCSVGQNRCNAQ